MGEGGAGMPSYLGDLRTRLGEVGTSMAALRLRGPPGDSSPEPLDPSEAPLPRPCSLTGLLSSSEEPESLSLGTAAAGRGRWSTACLLGASRLLS